MNYPTFAGSGQSGRGPPRIPGGLKLAGSGSGSESDPAAPTRIKTGPGSIGGSTTEGGFMHRPLPAALKDQQMGKKLNKIVSNGVGYKFYIFFCRFFFCSSGLPTSPLLKLITELRNNLLFFSMQ